MHVFAEQDCFNLTIFFTKVEARFSTFLGVAAPSMLGVK